MTALLAVEGLTMRFGGVVAVDGVSLAIAEGELRCLIGPNGAGKSTLLKCLTGQLAPTRGRILWRGREVTGLAPFAMARLGLGIKTQVPSLFDGLTVLESVVLAVRRRHGAALAGRIAEATLERLGIHDLALRQVGRLAHGQRQLVELAMVVAPMPDLVVLDEPTAGMTAEETHATGQLIRELARSLHLSTIVIEHDINFVRDLAAPVTVLHLGRILTEGAFEAVAADQRVRDVYLGTG
jgi:branched-chain amino acid transport system ATP-binding protein